MSAATTCPPRRRTRRAAPLAALAAAALCALAGASRAGAQPSVDAERALSSYAAMQQQYYMPYHHLYRGEETENAQEFAYLWPYSQALAATSAVAGIPALGASAFRRMRFSAKIATKNGGCPSSWEVVK